MIYKIILFAFFCFPSIANSQSKSSNVIVSEGKASIKITPDIVIITLTVEKQDTVEKNAIVKLNSEISKLVDVLTKLGFNNKSIKIADLNISSSSNYSDDKEKKNYTATNTLKIEFGLDTKVVDAIYVNVQEAGLSDLDIDFDTKLSDSLEKSARIKLVQQAIEDAKANAENIAQTLKIKLGKVKQVSKYTDGYVTEVIMSNQMKFTPPKIVGDTQFAYQTSFAKFDVDGIELEEQIIISYEIEKQ